MMEIREKSTLDRIREGLSYRESIITIVTSLAVYFKENRDKFASTNVDNNVRMAKMLRSMAVSLSKVDKWRCRVVDR